MRVRRRVLILTLGAAALIGAAGLIRAALRPRPALPFDQIVALARARRHAEAEARAGDFLREHPASDPARMLLAQMALDRPGVPTPVGQRPDPAPALAALGLLDQIRTADPQLAALVQLYRGKAQHRLARLDEAEASWIEALRLNPAIPEAGWCLLERYYLLGRSDEARRLALRLHQIEPDPRDRVQLLLELVRQDARPLAPESVVERFEPITRQNPDDLGSNLALGLALVRAGQVDRGLGLLERQVERHPADPKAWEAWLSGLDDAGRLDGLAQAVTRLPTPLADSERFARHRGRVAQERGDGPAAVAA